MPDNQYSEILCKNFIWIDLEQPNSEILNEIAAKYQLDYFQIKDSLEYGHLPKFEKQPGYNFLIVRAFTSTIDQGETTITALSNKIAFFYNGNKIVTIHRSPFSFLHELDGNNYAHPEDLLLQLVYKMAATYDLPLHELDQKIEHLEKIIFLDNYQKVSLEDLYYLKTQTRITKKLLQLFQQAIIHLEVAAHNQTALQNIKDKLISLILNYDEVLENANNLLNTYHSINAKKSNDVMKLLTVFSAFFLPMTFLAGIYGMNFDYMPELKWQYGYFLAWGAMALIALVVYLWFKRKKII